MMKKAILIILPLMLLVACGHKETEKKVVVTKVMPANRGSVTITPVTPEAKRVQRENGDGLIVWGKNHYVINQVTHRRPSNPSLPGYVLSFTGVNMKDGSHAVVMMQVPAMLKVGHYKVLFDPDLGKRLGDRDSKEMTVIGQVVRTNTQGEIVTSEENSGNILNEGTLECTSIDNTNFSVKAKLKCKNGEEYSINYSGVMNR